MKRITVALVGDFDEKIHTLTALNHSIEHSRSQLAFTLNCQWIHTEKAADIISAPEKYNGVWIVPGSPYKNDSGVYDVIRMAREKNIPIYGSCGGFQYMLLEYAKNVLKISNAGHEESEPDSVHVIYKLSCSLKGQEEVVTVPEKNSWLYTVLGQNSVTGRYYCSYGVNPAYQEMLNKYPLLFTAYAPTGEVRAFELMDHRFYKGTLFQPPLDSSPGKPNPLIVSFFNACARDSSFRHVNF